MAVGIKTLLVNRLSTYCRVNIGIRQTTRPASVANMEITGSPESGKTKAGCNVCNNTPATAVATKKPVTVSTTCRQR